MPLLNINYWNMKYIILIVLFPLTGILQAQNYQTTWSRCYGGTGNDVVRSIIPHDNGYLFFGSTNSHDGDVLNNPMDESLVGWLVGIDSIGNIEFDRCYTGFGEGANGYNILRIDSGYFLFGQSGPTNYSNLGGLQDGYWFAKTDQTFNIVWQEVFGGSGDEEPTSIILTEDSGVLGLGRTTSTDGDIEINYGYWDNWLVCLDEFGNKNWIKTIGCSKPDAPSQIILTYDSNYLFCSASSSIDTASLYCQGHDLLNEEAKLIKIDTTGEILWFQCYGGSHTDGFSDVLELEDGYICLGSSKSNDFDLQSHHGTPGQDADLWIAKTDLNGELQWSELYGGSHFDMGLKIFSKSKGGYTIFGHTKSQNGDVIGNTTIQRTYILWMLEIDENGELLYQKPFIELENLGSLDILQVSDYKYVIATTKITHGCHHTYPNVNDDIYVFEIQDMDEFIPSQPIGADEVCVEGNAETIYTANLVVDTMETQWQLIPEEAGTLIQLHDTALVQWNSNYSDTAWLQVRAVNEYGESSYSEFKQILLKDCTGFGEIQQKQLKTYPNPAQTFITFDLPVITSESKLQIKNIFGITVKEVSLLREQTQFVWDCSQILAGVYFYHTEIDGTNYSGKILIQ